MNIQAVPKNDFRGGYYTVGEAARILRLDGTQKVRNWAFGNSRVLPVIERQYQESASELGFLDLLEIRFLNVFRKQGISLQSLRRAAENAREVLKMRHPFATSLKFIGKRREIFMLTAEQRGDHDLLELTAGSGQYAFYEVLEQHLSDGIEYDPGTEIAKRWRPEPKKYPNVALVPFRAHGHPTLEPSGVPTKSIYDLFRSEDNDLGSVADWFDLEVSSVREAVQFEIDISAMDGA